MTQEMIVEGQKIVIQHTFAAPIERVYQAWTDPQQIVQWFRPNERWNSSVVDIDPTPGGRHNITMHHTDGDEFRNLGRYVEIVPNERLSFTWNAAGSTMGGEETFVTIDFRAVSNGTELTLTHDRHTDPKVLEQTTSGWTGILETLNTYLEA